LEVLRLPGDAGVRRDPPHRSRAGRCGRARL